MSAGDGQADSVFATTRWTLVLRAQGSESPAAREALADLCAAYWTPVFRFLRRDGHDEESARELTQEFFARLLARGSIGGADPARGRFRSFLLGAVKHFLADRRDRERALKRGAGRAPVPLSTGTDTVSELPVPDPASPSPDAAFDRDWAFAVVERALAALADEMAAAGRTELFGVLKPWLVGEVPSLSQAEAARALGLSEGAVKVAIHRLRKRFRELVKNEIAQTLSSAEDVQGELRYLVDVLARG